MRRIMNSVNGLDRNCQVRTAGKLIHLVDLLVLHVTRSSPGLRLSMTQMTGIVGLNTTGSHQSVVLRSNCPGLGLHAPKNTGKRGRLAFIDAASGRKFTRLITRAANAGASTVVIYVFPRKAHVKFSVGASNWTEILSIVASSLAHYNRSRDGRRVVSGLQRGRVPNRGSSENRNIDAGVRMTRLIRLIVRSADLHPAQISPLLSGWGRRQQSLSPES